MQLFMTTHISLYNHIQTRSTEIISGSRQKRLPFFTGNVPGNFFNLQSTYGSSLIDDKNAVSPRHLHINS